jgi:hypothetical protein
MIRDKKEFYTGFAMLVAFFIVLAIFFSPVFGGKNGLDYLDNLYNSISKDSAYYIPAMVEEAEQFEDEEIDMTVTLPSANHAANFAQLLGEAGVQAQAQAEQVAIDGNLGTILFESLEDAEYMYRNNGEALETKYGMEPRLIMYTWYQGFKSMDKTFTRNKDFDNARFVSEMNVRAVELTYNYFGVEPRSIMSEIFIVIGSLLFYVIYTIWYGYAILFMFEGWGLRLGH